MTCCLISACLLSVPFVRALSALDVDFSPDLAVCDQDDASASSTVSLLQTGLSVKKEAQLEYDPGLNLPSPIYPTQSKFIKKYGVDVPDLYTNSALSYATDFYGKYDHQFPIGEEIIELWYMYGLNNNSERPRKDPFFKLIEGKDGTCYLTVPYAIAQTDKLGIGSRSLNTGFPIPTMNNYHYVFEEKPRYSSFMFGACPQVLKVEGRKRLRHMGFNPALIKLPSKLKKHYPTGCWLIMGNFPMNVVQILNEGFEMIHAATIQMAGFEDVAINPSNLIEDPRLFLMNDDTVALAFLPYALQAYPAFKMAEGNGWWNHELVATLHIAAHETPEGPRLDVSVKRSELRRLKNCQPNDKRNTFEGQIEKNGGFMQAPGSDQLYLVDWVYPPAAGKLDLKAAPIQDGLIVGHTCFGYGNHSKLKNEEVFGTSPPFGEPLLYGDAPGGLHGGRNKPSNGPSLIWLNETQEFLGVAHFHRGFGDSEYNYVMLHGEAGRWGHHYTHFFYTLAAEPPFRMLRLSPEWCLPSDLDSEDCDSIQFVTGLQRDGDNLVMSYGVMDQYGYVVTVNVATAVESLRPVE